jgi:hypothetical protein
MAGTGWVGYVACIGEMFSQNIRHEYHFTDVHVVGKVEGLNYTGSKWDPAVGSCDGTEFLNQLSAYQLPTETASQLVTFLNNV